MAIRYSCVAPRSSGFSIVEIMVAMALSLLLLVGVIAIFSSAKASYETTNHLSRIQENGRFALDTITRDIRATGYVGCARAPTYLSTSLQSSALLPWDFLSGPVRGFQSTGEETWEPELDEHVSSAADGSDVLVLRIPEPGAEPLRVITSMTTAADPLTVPNVTNSQLNVGDIALAYSCEAQAYFQVTSFAAGEIGHVTDVGTPGNAVDDLSYVFRENAEVIPVQTVIYYIRRSTAAIAGTAPDDTLSLWRRVGDNDAQELVEGVQQMELRFGRDTNGDAVVDEYVTANSVTNWGSVYSVSVALLVRSPNEYGNDTDQRTYQLLDVPVEAPADRHLREVFATTASIRNRVPVN
jgi:type IV pilus assembly protein PilW